MIFKVGKPDVVCFAKTLPGCLLLFLFFILIHFSGMAQHAWTPDSLLSRTRALDDMDSLHLVILKSHPNPFVFVDETVFEANYDSIRNSIDSVITLRNFAGKIADFIVPLRDSHTTMDFYAMQKFCFEQDGHFLPLNIYSSNDSILVEDDWEGILPKGSRIISINGVDANVIHKEAMRYSCIEADAEVGQNRVADAVFPIILAWNHFIDEENEVVVQLPQSDSSFHIYSLKGFKKMDYKITARLRARDKKRKAVSFDINDSTGIAVLRVATFAPLHANEFRRKIKKSFKSISKSECKTLVLDLRDNSGGSSAWVEYLYSFVDENGYNTPSNVIGRNSELAMERSKVFNKGISKLIIQLFYRNDEDVQSFRRFARLPVGMSDTTFFSVPTKQKSSHVYKGECFLLINGLTASAGVDFTNQFKRMKRGLIVGEPCLGPVSGTFGNPASYRLKNSGLNVNIATIRYNYDNSFEYSRAPIAPDIYIQLTSVDLKSSSDPSLRYIESNRSNK